MESATEVCRTEDSDSDQAAPTADEPLRPRGFEDFPPGEGRDSQGSSLNPAAGAENQADLADAARSMSLESRNILCSSNDDDVVRRFHTANIANRYEVCGEPSCQKLAADLPAGKKLAQCSGAQGGGAKLCHPASLARGIPIIASCHLAA